MYKIVYLPLAEADILSAVDYLAETLENPSAAAVLLDALEQTVESLTRFPYANPVYPSARPLRDELRQVPVKGYVLYYHVSKDTVEIRRLIHGRRDRWNMEI